MYRKVRGINWLSDVVTIYANGEVFTHTLDGREISQSTVNMIEARKHAKS